MVTLKNNLCETKWWHGEAARKETVLAVEWLNFRRNPRVKVKVRSQNMPQDSPAVASRSLICECSERTHNFTQ